MQIRKVSVRGDDLLYKKKGERERNGLLIALGASFGSLSSARFI